MPQMMPLYWAPLFMLFSMILLASVMKIYFSINKSFYSDPMKNKIFNQTKKSNWLW